MDAITSSDSQWEVGRFPVNYDWKIRFKKKIARLIHRFYFRKKLSYCKYCRYQSTSYWLFEYWPRKNNPCRYENRYNTCKDWRK